MLCMPFDLFNQVSELKLKYNTIRALRILLFFMMGFVFHKYGAAIYHNYIEISPLTLIKSPLSYWRVQRRSWNSFNELQYTKDHESMYFRRYVATVLLPLIIDGKRLSDFYPLPKIGGAITAVGKTVIILDRLGGLHRYDLATGSFGTLSGI